MKDLAKEQQRLNQIMPRYAPDQPEQTDQTVGWEEFASLPVVPRRSPWRTLGSEDDDLLAQVSDNQVVLNAKSISNLSLTGTPSPAGGSAVTIKILTRVYVSGTNLMAEYTSYRIPATGGTKTEEVIVEGASC